MNSFTALGADTYNVMINAMNNCANPEDSVCINNEIKKEIIDLYESPRDSGAQLQKFLQVLAEHRQQLEERMQDIQLTLDEVRAQEKEAQQLLRKLGTREST